MNLNLNPSPAHEFQDSCRSKHPLPILQVRLRDSQWCRPSRGKCFLPQSAFNEPLYNPAHSPEPRSEVYHHQQADRVAARGTVRIPCHAACFQWLQLGMLPVPQDLPHRRLAKPASQLAHTPKQGISLHQPSSLWETVCLAGRAVQPLGKRELWCYALSPGSPGAQAVDRCPDGSQDDHWILELW